MKIVWAGYQPARVPDGQAQKRQDAENDKSFTGRVNVKAIIRDAEVIDTSMFEFTSDADKGVARSEGLGTLVKRQEVTTLQQLPGYHRDEILSVKVATVTSVALVFDAGNELGAVLKSPVSTVNAVNGVIGSPDGFEEISVVYRSGKEEGLKPSAKDACHETPPTTLRSAHDTDLILERWTGMGISKKGFLKIDPVILAEAKDGTKEETFRLVQSAASPPHDRASFSYTHLAVFYSKVQEALAQKGPEGKEDMANDEKDVKDKFEKRINEIRMLLENSYDLKDVFNERLSKRNGRGEET